MVGGGGGRWARVLLRSAASLSQPLPMPAVPAPAAQAASKFALVPGPGDLGPGGSLPRPGLPVAVAAPLLEAVPNAVLASNPCR